VDSETLWTLIPNAIFYTFSTIAQALGALRDQIETETDSRQH
jgi:hypothetical protein